MPAAIYHVRRSTISTDTKMTSFEITLSKENIFSQHPYKNIYNEHSVKIISTFIGDKKELTECSFTSIISLMFFNDFFF